MVDVVAVSGLAELRQALLRDLPEALQGKASQAALAKAARPIVNSARALAPSRKPPRFAGPMPSSAAGGRVAPGKLRRSIYSARSKESTKTNEVRIISVRGRAYYWRFIEFGRGQVVKQKGSLGTPRKGFFGKQVRATPARPFMRPAFEANKLRAIDIYAKELQPAIAKVAKQAQARNIRRLTREITGF